MWKVNNEMVDDAFEQVKSEVRRRHLRKNGIKQTYTETNTVHLEIYT